MSHERMSDHVSGPIIEPNVGKELTRSPTPRISSNRFTLLIRGFEYVDFITPWDLLEIIPYLEQRYSTKTLFEVDYCFLLFEVSVTS